MMLRTFWRRLSVAFRFARRSAWANRGQSVLIVLLLVVPLATVVAFLTLLQSQVSTVEEAITIRLGASAEAELLVVSAPDQSLRQNPIEAVTWEVEKDPETGERIYSDPRGPRVDPATVFPEGTRILTVLRKGAFTLETKTGISHFFSYEGEVWDPALQGAYTLVDGSAPSAPGEILVTPPLLDRLGKQVGDEVSALDPSRTLTITGVIDPAAMYRDEQLVYAFPGTAPEQQPDGRQLFLPDTELTWADVEELNKHGITAYSRTVLENPPTDAVYVHDGRVGQEALLGLVIAFGVFEIAVLAGAAFLVGARRQQRTFGLLSSTGMERGTLAQIVTSTGVVLGTVAAIVGTALGIGAAWVLMRLFDNGNATEWPGFHIPWVAIATAAIFSVLVGWAASLVPALLASKVNVMAALRGATRPARPQRRSARAGYVLLVVGAVLAVVATVGLSFSNWGTFADVSEFEDTMIAALAVLLVIAAILIAIALLLLLSRILRFLARMTTTMSLPWRLATRDLARNSSRTTPMVAVVLVTVSAATLFMMAASYTRGWEENYKTYQTPPGQLRVHFAKGYEQGTPSPAEAANLAKQIEELAKNTLPVAQVRTIEMPWQDWYSFRNDLEHELVIPVEDPAQACPRDTAGNAVDAKDPRCDIRYLTPRLQTTGARGPYPTIAIGDAADLAMMMGVSDLREEEREAVEAGKVLAHWPFLVSDDGNATIGWEHVSYSPNYESEITRAESIPTMLLQTTNRLNDALFMSPETARSLGLVPTSSTVLIDPSEKLDTDTVDSFAAALRDIDPEARIENDRRPESSNEWALVGFVFLAMISAAAITIGLGRLESRRTEFTFQSLGADPGVSRRTAALTTWAQSSLAVLFGVFIGLIPGFGIFGPLTTEIDMTIPWLELALILVAPPLLFSLVTFLFPPRATLTSVSTVR